jgi:uncharacterized membrane protein YphA (DoxX/SURF4 family)
MKEVIIKLLAAVTVAAIMSVAAIWGWNTLFGEFKTFSFDLKTILAVMAVSFVFTGSIK